MRLAADRADDANAHRRISLPGNRILNRRYLRIERIGVIDHVEVRDAIGIRLPICDAVAVRTPAPAIAQIQFLFIDPVKGAVDDSFGTVPGELRDATGSYVLNIQIIFTHITYASSVRRELGKHQGRGRRIFAELRQLLRVDIKNPIVSPRVLPPNLLSVREDHKLLSV